MNKKFRILLSASLSLLLLFSMFSAVLSTNIRVFVDDHEVFFSQPPVMIQNSVLVPLRGVFEQLGAEVQWDSATRTITATRNGTEVIIRVGSYTASVNGETVRLTTPAAIIRGSTMVPLRFVSESLGADVKWRAATSTVYIFSGTQAGQPTPAPASAAAPNIQSVSHDAAAALHPGDTLNVTIEGDPGCTASFDIFGVATKVPMREVSNGRYTGSFQIPSTARSVGNAAVFGRLSRGGRESMLATPSGVTITAESVRISKVLPKENSTVKTNLPNMLVVFTGSGSTRVIPSSVRLYLNNLDVTNDATIDQDIISYIPKQNLNPGVNTAFVSAADTDGNSITKEWSFIVQTGATIQSVTHNATRPLVAGDVITVTMIGDSGGNATFDIGTYRVNIPMAEASAGRYVGNYTVQPADSFANAYIIGRLTLPGRPSVSLSATTPVSVSATAQGNLIVTITSPSPNDVVGEQFEIAGSTSPYATVSLNVKLNVAGGFINVDVLSTDVQANESGQFRYQFNGMTPIQGGTYTITAVAKNSQGQQSAPASVTVKRK
ncbi:MAG: copper amine oxidase N-terminal domain-containing protein [Firmicutes bacterium]|nr:copper amine oxidase N-terminal domain-containing protein [Bacillota bacterium]